MKETNYNFMVKNFELASRFLIEQESLSKRAGILSWIFPFNALNTERRCSYSKYIDYRLLKISYLVYNSYLEYYSVSQFNELTYQNAIIIRSLSMKLE